MQVKKRFFKVKNQKQTILEALSAPLHPFAQQPYMRIPVCSPFSAKLRYGFPVCFRQTDVEGFSVQE